MARRTSLADLNCAIAQSLDIVGDWWTLLVIRDVARGLHRFEELHTELGISRKVLTERLNGLVEHGVLARRPYQHRPPRHEYVLTGVGRGLLPVLVSLQEWGDTWVLGDGTTTATASPESAEARRVHDLVGVRIPELTLPGEHGPVDPIADTPLTVVYCYPGTGVRAPEWTSIPGAVGCTLESCTYRDRLADFTDLGATVHGVSTQRPDEQRAFATAERIPFPLLSDAGLHLTAALRLPTFRAGGVARIKRLTLIVGADRVIRRVLYPIADVTGSVADALAAVRAASS